MQWVKCPFLRMFDKKLKIFYTVFIPLLSAISLIDAMRDHLIGQPAGWNLEEILVFFIHAVGIISIFFLWFSFSRLLDRAEKMVREANRQRDEFHDKHQNLIHDMRVAVHDQFLTWKFSPAEIRIAEMLIRGYSTRQIAAILNRSEKTVRNQALSIYEKSGMTGRSDLSAYFLSDILGEEK